MKSQSIVNIGIAFFAIMTVWVVVDDEKRVISLQKQVAALKDTQDGVDNHLRFVDSDHAKLGNDIAKVRQDVDYLRYRNQPEER